MLIIRVFRREELDSTEFLIETTTRGTVAVGSVPGTGPLSAVLAEMSKVVAEHERRNLLAHGDIWPAGIIRGPVEGQMMTVKNAPRDAAL